MKVLLSIKPEFANKIFDGTKKYEFRRSIFKNSEIKKIVVYAASPVQKIIGEFEIDHILSDDPVALWDQTKEYSGVSEEYFFEYFGDKTSGYAIKIKSTRLYKTPKCIRQDFNLHPPQSFLYLA
jgi:predicted transcriptional regulator